MGLNSTLCPRPLLAPVVTSFRGQKSLPDDPFQRKALRRHGYWPSGTGMSDPQSLRRTPLSTDPVGSLVGEFMEEKRKERQEEKARQAPKKRNPFMMPFLIVLCLAVWIAPSLMPPREPVLTPEILEQGARLNLYLASLRVREYHVSHQRLPATLTQVGVDTTGILYVRSSDSVFELVTRVQGARMVYRSSLPDSVFLGANLRIRGIS